MTCEYKQEKVASVWLKIKLKQDIAPMKQVCKPKMCFILQLNNDLKQ